MLRNQAPYLALLTGTERASIRMPGLESDERHGGIRVHLTLYHDDMIPDQKPDLKLDRQL
jgi:hypothetical protein